MRWPLVSPARAVPAEPLGSRLSAVNPVHRTAQNAGALVAEHINAAAARRAGRYIR